MYKKSIFTVEEQVSKDETLLYNMLTQSYIVYDNKNVMDWFRDLDSTLLLKGKFIVDSSLDERDYLMNIFADINDFNREINIVLSITMNCNMKCLYCYEEDTYNINKINIEKHVIAGFVKWINEINIENNINKVHILLFGGEPLLNILHLQNVVNYLVKNINVSLSFSLATNGINITREIFSYLIKKGLTSVQIPLDGGREMHTLRRPLKSKNTIINNFDKILDNILEIKDLNLELILKINIDKNNIHDVENLLKILSHKNLQGFITIKFEVVAVTFASLSQEDHFCNTYVYDSREEETAEAYHYCMSLAEKYNFKNSETIGNITPCMYTSKNQFVIGVEGNIYKCISAIGLDAFKIGNVFDEKQNIMYSTSLDRINIAQECFELKCPYIPKCGGGCAYESFLKDNDINIKDCKYKYMKKYYFQKFTDKYLRSKL